MIGCEDMCEDRLCRLTRVFEFSTDYHYQLTLKMASAQDVETSVNNNSPSRDSNHPDDLFQSRNNNFIIVISHMGVREKK